MLIVFGGVFGIWLTVGFIFFLGWLMNNYLLSAPSDFFSIDSFSTGALDFIVSVTFGMIIYGFGWRVIGNFRKTSPPTNHSSSDNNQTSI